MDRVTGHPSDQALDQLIDSFVKFLLTQNMAVAPAEAEAGATKG
jgi:hypothetical protein